MTAESHSRIWAATIGALALIAVAVIQKGGIRVSGDDEPKRLSALTNARGEIGRVEELSGCAKAPWVDVLEDGLVRLGLAGTTTSLAPQSASFVVERRTASKADFESTEPLEIAVGQSKTFDLPDGRRLAVKVESVSPDNCTARYSLWLRS